MPETLYLIDGHALAYRTYFALTGAGRNTARWQTSKGEPTAGIYGFASVLMRYLEQDRPDYLAVAFDVGRTFRDDLFADYKGTREKMPEDLATQIVRIREMVDIFNMPRLEMPGFEADDVLGSVAQAIAGQGIGVKIITGDRDLLQLVDDRVIVTLPEGRSLAEARDYTLKDVVEKMGVRPDQIVDYKALVGDSSDNIPGVKGVGAKTAEKLLADYDTLDAVYAHLADIRPTIASKLEADKDNAYMSQELAQIIVDLDIPFDLDTARVDNFELQPVLDFFRQMEFQSLTKRLTAVAKALGQDVEAASEPGQQMSLFGKAAPASAPATDTAARDESIAEVIDTPDGLASLVDVLEQAALISFDTETTSTDQMQAVLVGISLAVEPGSGYYIPVGHDEGRQLDLDVVLEALRGPLTDPAIPKVAHNLKYDYVILARYGLSVHPLSFDTMLAEWLRDPNSRNLGLKKLAWVRLNVEMTEISALIGRGKKQVTMAQVSIADAAAYAGDDAEVLVRLKPLLEADMEARGVTSLFHDMEMRLTPILADMEMAGISLDVPFLEEMSADLQTELADYSGKIYNAVGREFNLNSTQQLSDALFTTLGLEPPSGTRKTASGHYSTAAGVLEHLREAHVVVAWILGYREISKLKSTYVDALPSQVNPETGRVHTSFNQAGSVTGRIASSDPNLQNIPIRTELGRRVRRAFVAAPGHNLLAVDYSQVELRVVAHMARDEAMIDAFRRDQDIHATTAAAIYGIDLTQVSKNQRRHAKAVNFGLIYGMSAFGLTRSTDLTLAESEDFVQAYFAQFPGVKLYLDTIRADAAKNGFVETLLGRRRYFPGLKDQSNFNVRAREEREAINAPIQGTAADILKLAMLRIPDALQEAGLNSRMLLQVHDELLFEVPVEENERAAQLVQQIMEGAYSLDVPLSTEARLGANWYSLEPLG
jgi:DNA polymerase-1